MAKATYRQLMRWEKEVKLGLASGGESRKSDSRITPEDRQRMYKDAARRDGKTIGDIQNENYFHDYILKCCGLK